MEFSEKLKDLNADQEFIEFATNKTLDEVWQQCQRGDWMLWLYKKLYPDDIKNLTLAKGHCAATVRDLITDERSLKAIDTAIAFGEGRASREELKAVTTAANAAAKAADAADVAEGVAVAADAAVYVGDTDAIDTSDFADANAFADYAAFAAADEADDADAAAYAADAAGTAASEVLAGASPIDMIAVVTPTDADNSAYGAAQQENQKLTASICRKYLPAPKY